MDNRTFAQKVMDFWNDLSPEFRYGIFYITSALLTLIQQLLSGFEWKSALITFISALLVQINGMQAVSKVAREQSAPPTDPEINLPQN